jgi:hypothetical protein
MKEKRDDYVGAVMDEDMIRTRRTGSNLPIQLDDTNYWKKIS